MNAARWLIGLALIAGCTAQRTVALQEDGTVAVDDKVKLFPETVRFLRDQAADQDSVMQWLARMDQSPGKEELRDWRRDGLDVLKWKVKSVVGGPSTIKTQLLLESADVRTKRIEPRLLLDVHVKPGDEDGQLRLSMGLPGMYLLRDVDLKSVVGLSQIGEESQIDFVLDVPGKIVSAHPPPGRKNGPEVVIAPGKVTWRFTPIQLASQGSGSQVAVVFQVPGAPGGPPPAAP